MEKEVQQAAHAYEVDTVDYAAAARLEVALKTLKTNVEGRPRVAATLAGTYPDFLPTLVYAALRSDAPYAKYVCQVMALVLPPAPGVEEPKSSR